MDEDFPRGGAYVKDTEEDITEDVIDEDLFQEKDDSEDEKPKSKKKKEKKRTDLEEDDDDLSSEESTKLTRKMLVTDMLLLGCIKDVKEYSILMSLPGGLLGSVSITNISDSYQDQLQLLASQSVDAEDLDIHGLQEMFKPGSVLPCKVLSINKSGRDKTMIELTINPKHINREFNTDSIREGMILFGSIASQEDQGYVVDLGIQAIKAFLRNKEAEKYIQKYNEGNPLMIGQSVMCKVLAGKGNKSSGKSRVVSLTIDPDQIKDSQITTDMKVPFRCLVPGMKIQVQVKNIRNDGCVVKFLQNTGTINQLHLSEEVDIDQQILSCVLYIHPITKIISFSNLPHLVNYKGGPLIGQFGQLTCGTIIEKAKVIKTAQKSILFSLPNKMKAVCLGKHLGDDRRVNVAKVYKTGTKHRCRVMDFDLIDNIVKVTLKQSLLNEKYLSINDIKTGDVIQCTVDKVVENGVTVKVTSSIQGFIPNTHLTNSTFHMNHTKMFKAGAEIKCRVLKVNPVKKNVILTCKSLLIKSKLPVITDFSQLQKDLQVEGYISLINRNGVGIKFYGDMKGFCPKKNLGEEEIEYPEKVFYIGQVIKARVLSWNTDTKKITLTMRVDPNKSSKKPDNLDIGLKIGEICSCEVTKVTDTGLDIKLPSGVQGYIPVKLLTDSLETSRHLVKTYKPGDTIDQAMYWSWTKLPILTTRKSVLEYGKDHEVVSSIDQIRIGMILPGTVDKVMSFGVFIKFTGQIIGLCPNKYALDEQIDDLRDVYQPDQPVVALVTDVDKAKNRFIVSLRMKDCFNGESDIGLDLVSTYLDEIRRILQINKGDHSKIKLGTVYSLLLEEVTDEQLTGILTVKKGPKVKAVCTKCHMDAGTSYKVGARLQCIPVYVDASNNLIDVIVTRKVVDAVNKHLKNKKDSLDVVLEMKVKGEIIVVKRDYMMAVLKDEHEGVIVYVPSREHVNDVLGVHRYTIGQIVPLVVKRLKENQIVCCLESQQSKEVVELQLGQLVTVRVKSVKDVQLNVECNGLHGRVHITKMVDSIENGSPGLKPDLFKKNSKIKARVIGFRTSFNTQNIKPIQRPEFSLKPSDLESKRDSYSETYDIGQKVIGYISDYDDNGLWMTISPSVTARVNKANLSSDKKILKNLSDHFKLYTGYNATVIKMKDNIPTELSLIDAPNLFKLGGVCAGEIYDIKEDLGIFVKFPEGEKGLVHLTEITDNFTDHPTAEYKISGCINCYILNCDDIKKCQLSLRKSRNDKSVDVTDPVIESKESLSVGQTLRGYVVKVTDSYLLVSFGRNITGIKHIGSDSSSSKISIGSVIKGKVISKKDDTIELSCNVTETSRKRKSEGDTGTKKKKRKEKDVIVIKDLKSELQKKLKRKTEEDSDSGIDVDVKRKKIKDNQEKECVELNVGWSWDNEYKPPVTKTPVSSDSDSDESENEQEKSKHNTQKDSIEEEKRLFEFEKQQLQGDNSVETAEDFDKLCLQSPDSSIIWLRYMAFHLESAEVEKARAVAERALKTISFREEQEKMNIWVAYLNLENMYGSPEELSKILERALQQNEPYNVYQHLVSIYTKSGKIQEAENTYNIIVRKFSFKREGWIGFGLFHFKNGNLDAARKVLPRSLKSLNKVHHVETIAKFAQMEFKHGEPERGKTMFENILSNYPKRTDLWSVYVDMVIKTGDIEAVRQLLNRVIHMKLSAKKMKFFFKKYLDFETAQGDQKQIDFVKKKAFEYVESKGFVDE